MTDPRSIDPSRCWVRHVRRTRAGETGTTIARGAFIADTVEELGGRQGWQSGELVFVLSDDGEGTFRFPNTYGEDGVLHRRRFPLLTDPAYRIGEDWLEVYRDADELVAVITPRDYNLGRSELVIKGPDVAGVLGRFRTGDLEPWVGAAPRDVFEHYTRAPILCAGTEYRNLGLPAGGGVVTSGTAADGTAYYMDAGVTSSVNADGETVFSAEANSAILQTAVAGAAGDCWTAEARFRVSADASGNGRLQLNVRGAGNALYLQALVDIATGDCTLTPFVNGVVWPLPFTTDAVSRRPGFVTLGTHSLRLTAFYDRLLLFVDGELVAEARRVAPFIAPAAIENVLYRVVGVIESCTVTSLAPYALRGADKGDRHLPGILPATGLRARIYNAQPVYSRYSTGPGRAARLPELVGDEPQADRLDPTVAFAAGAAAPSLAGAAAVIWTGAVYLDLAASDRRLRVNYVGGMRLYVGRCLPGDAAIDDWLFAGPAPKATAPLRSLLGSKAGWYPIRLELQGILNSLLSITLEDGAADGAGVVAVYATVPQSRLSPLGTFDELVRLETHRELLGRIAQDFGYQWRVEPRQLESGEFPGQIIPRVHIGRDTAKTVTVDEAVDVAVEGTAGDAVDRLLGDAAGVADPKGSGQLTGEVIDYANAAAHAALHSDYESLSEISELAMLETRLGSLLALRSAVNETVGARPSGQRDLVDTFPLSGALARLDWKPGDGVLLDLADVDVRDNSPRQLVRTSWPITPQGYGRPVVGFRQRPRDPAAVLRRALRVALSGQRNYQGTLVERTGALGGALGTGAPNFAVDGYSRVGLPDNLDDVAGAYVLVEAIAGAWVLEVNGINTGIAVAQLAPYDVTRWVQKGAGHAQGYARLITPAPATAASSYALRYVLLLKR